MKRVPPPEPSLIVVTVCRWVKAFILLYGIQIVLFGHLTPGGGFAGGVVAACAFILISMAEGAASSERAFPSALASSLDSVGALLFLAMALLGLVMTGTFFANVWETPASSHFTPLSGGIIVPSNVGIGLKVCCSIYLVFLVTRDAASSALAGRDGPDTNLEKNDATVEGTDSATYEDRAVTKKCEGQRPRFEPTTEDQS